MTYGWDGARHTAQGRARGQRRGTLDDDEGYDARQDWGSYEAANLRELGTRTEPRLRTLAAGGCWCGKSHGHNWLGKAAGAPHPGTNALTDWWEDVLVRLVRRGLPYPLVQQVWESRRTDLAATLVKATDAQLRELADLWRAQQAEAS